MRKFKKILALAMVAFMLLALAACNPETSGDADKTEPAAQGKVYYLNFKPEADEQWQSLATKYKEEKGIEVTVVTAASGEYETTLKSEMAKSDAPTLFHVNGPVGLTSWKDYCYDLKDSTLVKNVTSDEFLLKDGDAVLAAAFAVETYGIIYNKKLLADYIAMDGAKITSVDEINTFETFKAVVEDIQAKKADLGIEGAFTSAGMDGSSDWRFKTHLANLPLYYEYKADGIGSTEAIKGTYLDNYKAIWDLYINNATCAPSELATKTGDDAVAEFATAEAVFYQNGTWAYGDVVGQDVADEDIGMLPILIGGEGEENQGLCTGTENFWCVNSKASAEDIKATIDFIDWCVTDAGAIEVIGKDMGFVMPTKEYPSDYLTGNPLLLAAYESTEAGKNPVSWNFPTMPGEDWKNGVGQALTAYAQGTGDWDAVKTAFVDGWATEYAKINAAAE